MTQQKKRKRKPTVKKQPAKAKAKLHGPAFLSQSGNLEKGFINLKNIPMCRVALLLFVNFILGLAILYITNTMGYFFPHLVCLTINIIITVLIGKEYAYLLDYLDDEISKKHSSENAELRICFQRFKKYAFHKANTILCIIILLIFFWGIFSQHYITLDLVGCYAVFIVCVTVSISVIGYAQYLWLLWFLYRTGKCTTMHYNKNNPSGTPFLVRIATLTNHAKWCFFFEGFLYVFEYYILIPKGYVSPNKLQMPDNTSFLITWFILFIVIILAFPAIIVVQERLMARIVENLKQQRIETLSECYEIISNTMPKGNLPVAETFMYNIMISNITSSADYPVKIQRFGPALISLATFCLHTVTLLSQLPSLSYLFQSIGS